MTLYDRKGRAVAYSEDNENIYLYSGIPVAYIFGNIVFSYEGRQLGRFEDGWMRDKKGCCVFFTEQAKNNGLVRPVKHIKPVKRIKKIKPIKTVRHIPMVKPIDKIAWSVISGEIFFMQ